MDSFKKTNKFFESGELDEIIKENKNYTAPHLIRFYLADYYKDIDEEKQSFDLLISQYAGFVSQPGKMYLKPNGLLLANDSHGDASMASIDNDYEFIGVIYYSNKNYHYTTKSLDKYFIPKKKDADVSKKRLEKTMKGIPYTKYASAYVFRKIKN